MWRLKHKVLLIISSCVVVTFLLAFKELSDSKSRFIQKELLKLMEHAHLRRSEVVPRSVYLTEEEMANVKECIDTKDQVAEAESQRYWAGNYELRYCRWFNHTYLTNDSRVVEIGGNIGLDTQEFVKRYGCQVFVFEPLPPYYRKLKEKFSEYKQVKIFNIGLGEKDADTVVKIQGNNGDASSFYTGKNETIGEKVKLRNVTRVFEEMRLATPPLDLLHVNCEGCEFYVLDALLHTSLVFNLKHIQFASHFQYAGVNDSVSQYCKLREILKRTHKLMYQFMFLWESWKLK